MDNHKVPVCNARLTLALRRCPCRVLNNLFFFYIEEVEFYQMVDNIFRFWKSDAARPRNIVDIFAILLRRLLTRDGDEVSTCQAFV